MIYRVYKIDSYGRCTQLQEFKSREAAERKIDSLVVKDGPDKHNDYDYECVYDARKAAKRE